MNQIGIRQVIVLILTSCLGIRWIPVAGSLGPSAVVYWVIGAIIFLLPLSLIVMELSSNYNEDGGIQLWVTKGLGKKAGYYVAWMYWVNNFFFYPALVIFMVANFAYLIGDSSLVDNRAFVIITVIICLWIAILINILGVKLISNITSLACILNVALGLFIIIAGISFLYKHQQLVTDFSIHSFIPNFSINENLSNLTLLMFALSGVELIPTLAGSIKDSRTTISRGLVVSIAIVMFIYIAGSLAINLIISPQELNNTTGLMEALERISIKLHFPLLAKFLILSLIFIELGALIVWLLAPTVMFFECIEKGILPSWLTKTNRNNIPGNALYATGVAITLIVILTHYLPTVNSIFTTLVLMGTIVYFIPYLFLAIAYVKIKLSNFMAVNLISNFWAIIIASMLFVSICLGVVLSFVPNSDLKTSHDIMIYEVELILGPVLFIFCGYLIYIRRKIS